MGFDKARAAQVIARGRAFLDASFPLATGSHAEAIAYRVKHGHLAVTLPSGETGLKQSAKFAGFAGTPEQPSAILLKNHHLHAELVINPQMRLARMTQRALRTLSWNPQFPRFAIARILSPPWMPRTRWKYTVTGWG